MNVSNLGSNIAELSRLSVQIVHLCLLSLHYVLNWHISVPQSSSKCAGSEDDLLYKASSSFYVSVEEVDLFPSKVELLKRASAPMISFTDLISIIKFRLWYNLRMELEMNELSKLLPSNGVCDNSSALPTQAIDDT